MAKRYIPIIAVTGSAGKSTTKEMIASILKTRGRIFKTPGNANLPEYIQKLRAKILPSHKAAVLEYGMFRAGHIRASCNLLRPTIGVITNIGTAHIGNFGGDLSQLAKAKSELIHYMKQTGKLFLNADDENSSLLEKGNFRGQIFTVGIKQDATYRAYDVTYMPQGMSFQVQFNKVACPFLIPVFGEHNIYNALFAIAVADQLGYTPEEMKKGLLNYARMPRRLTVIRLKNGVKLIDDSYSANPQATKAAIDVLTKLGKGRNIVVLGSMLELGSFSPYGHRAVGNYLAKQKVDYFLTFGYEALYAHSAAIYSGFPQERVKHFHNRAELHRFLHQLIVPNTTILVKGSHNMKMDETVNYIKANMK